MTDSHEHPHEDWQQRLRAGGHRLTPQRGLVLTAVETLGHATPDEVFAEVRRRAPGINLSTIYRTLELLDDLGLIRHAHLSDRAPTYHAVTGGEHFHLVCRGCGQVRSVGVGRIEPWLSELQQHDGFVADVSHLTVFGRCAECVEAASSDADAAAEPSGPAAGL